MKSEMRLRNISLNIICLTLAFLPPSLDAQPQAAPTPDISITPLPQVLAASASAVPAQQTADPRMTLLAERLLTAVQELKLNRTNPHTPGVTVARTRGGSTATSTLTGLKSGIQLLARSAGQGQSAPLSVKKGAFSVKMRTGGTLRALSVPYGEVLQNAVRRNGVVSDTDTALSFLRNRRSLLGLADPEHELKLRVRQLDRLGHRHLRYQQIYKGLPIWNAELIAQLDEHGNLISISGAYSSTPIKLVTRPIVDKQLAIDIVRAEYRPDAISSDPDLVVYVKDGTPRLAWKTEVEASLTESWIVMVDAHAGRILAKISQVETNNVQGQGSDLFGRLQSLNVWQEGGVHFMVDTSKVMFDPASNPPQLSASNGVIAVQDAANQPPNDDPQTLPTLFSVTSAAPSGPWLAAGVSAAANLSAVYDYYLSQHNRNSLDDLGGNLIAVVRIGMGFNNALFDSSTQTMYFGDAQPYAGALDVVAHEMTHGVVGHSARLVYEGQSGALNESFADIFGEMVEASVNGQPDWLVGSDLSSPLRNMSNPSALDTYLGVPYPSRMSEFVFTSEDYGGVHINSSIINHAFYLLAVGLTNAVGIDAAASIFYRTLTTKLSPLSEFTDLRLGAIQSAEELFGAGSQQAEQAALAFDAVQVFDVPTNPEPTPFPGIAGPDATLFSYFDATAGTYFLGRLDPTFGDVVPGSQLSVNPVFGASPSISGDGTFAVFVDAQQDVCLIATDALSPETCLGFPGEIASVAMAPDGETFGIVFLDALGNPTNTIGVINIATSQQQVFLLVAPVFDGVSSIEVIQADAMDFTADSRFLVYDAFNAISFDDGTIAGLWSIYAIDLITGTTLAVIPPIRDVNTAFPAVAQTSDGHLTFDYFDIAANENIVVTANVFTGAVAGIASTGSNFSMPTYTGDDSGIIFSFEDLLTPTGASLFHWGLLPDRVTPTGSASLWLSDAVGGEIYRHGGFNSPIRIDLGVSQSTNTRAGHFAEFSVRVDNQGPDDANNVLLTSTFLSGVNVVSVNTTCGNCDLSTTPLRCSLGSISVTGICTIDVESQVQSSISIDSAISVIADETDADTADNMSFATVAASALNIAPSLVTPFTTSSATESSSFTKNVSGNFNDSDGDTLTFSATGLPSSLGINPSTGVISGTPSAADVRSTAYTVTVTGSDSFGGTASGAFALNVNAAPSSGGGGGGGGGCSLGGDGVIDPTLFLLVLLSLLHLYGRRLGISHS